ncbi:MAG: FtsW/RodA/SpoVE family cell cycle protein, partial [Patescibacteria group bacterium]
MAFIRNSDKELFWTVVILFVGGILILSSASIVLSEKNSGTFYYYTLRQIVLGGLVGFLGLFAAMKIPYRVWRKASVPLMVGSFILLALLLIPQFGFSHGGATRWLSLGFINFQP